MQPIEAAEKLTSSAQNLFKTRYSDSSEGSLPLLRQVTTSNTSKRHVCAACWGEYAPAIFFGRSNTYIFRETAEQSACCCVSPPAGIAIVGARQRIVKRCPVWSTLSGSGNDCSCNINCGRFGRLGHGALCPLRGWAQGHIVIAVTFHTRSRHCHTACVRSGGGRRATQQQ